MGSPLIKHDLIHLSDTPKLWVSFLVVLAKKNDCDSWFLSGGLIIYQGNPSICPKRTPITQSMSQPKFASGDLGNPGGVQED